MSKDKPKRVVPLPKGKPSVPRDEIQRAIRKVAQIAKKRRSEVEAH